MSDKDTEMNLSDKLLEIIEDELSNLNFNIKVKDKDDLKASCLLVDEDVEDRSEERISPPNANKGEKILQEARDKNDEVCANENISVRSKKVVVQESEHHAFKNQNDKAEVINADVFHPISDRLAEKILWNIEDNFRDYNIYKNSFLLDHVLRNKGFASLKMVASFRKVRTITRDIKQVAYSLLKSKVLEFDAEKSRVCRIEPLPKIEKTSFGKTVMVFNLPQQNLNREYITELFSKFGTVVEANIFDSSIETSAYHKRCLHFHRQIASKIYGVVEFEEYSQVVNALRDEDGHLPKENEMKVVPLLPQVYKKQKRNLRFLKQYNQYPRRGYGRFKPKDDTYGKNEKPASNGDVNRNAKGNNGAYQYKRGYYRRSYRGRKPFGSADGKDYSDSQTQYKYSGFQSRRWVESRQLKANNSMNIDRLYSTSNRRRIANGYAENGI